jgi:hypothetical protein
VLTLHAAGLLRLFDGDDRPVPGGAVAVAGDRIAAAGPYDELAAAHPDARVRRWPGTLGPARVHDGPLPEAPTPRERVHALLARGVCAVPSAAVPDLADRRACERAGVLLAGSRPPRPPVVRPSGVAHLAVFDDDGRCLATVLNGRLVYRRA